VRARWRCAQILGFIVLTLVGDRDKANMVNEQKFANMVLFILLSVFAGVGCAILLLLKPAPPVADEGAAAGAADEVSLMQTLKLFVSSLRMQARGAVPGRCRHGLTCSGGGAVRRAHHLLQRRFARVLPLLLHGQPRDTAAEQVHYAPRRRSVLPHK
jgi:hypothetical protein